MSRRFYLELSERLGLIRSAYVEADIGRNPAPTEFYIDTGSPVSLLSPELCERMQIPINRLDFEDDVAIGGEFIRVAMIDPVKLTFYSEETGNTASVKMPIYVSDYTRETPRDVVDNILGMTFFANTPTDLHLNTNSDDRSMETFIEVKD